MRLSLLPALVAVSALTAVAPAAQPRCPGGTAGNQVQQPRVITDGNSLTAGAGLAFAQSYPCQLGALLGSTYTVDNFGVSGQSTMAMRSDAATQIDTLRNASNYELQVVVAWEGSNELMFTGNAQHSFDEMEDYCLDRKAAGLTCIVGTVLPRSDPYYPGHTGYYSFESNRITYNNWIRQYWRFFADAMFDPAANSTIGDSGDELNSTYYQADRVHLTQAGAAIVAGLVRAEVDRLAAIDVRPTAPFFFDDFTYADATNSGLTQPWTDVDGNAVRTERGWYNRWWEQGGQLANSGGRIAFVQDSGNPANRMLRLRVLSGGTLVYGGDATPGINSPYSARSGTWMARVSFDDLGIGADQRNPLHTIQAFWLDGQAKAWGPYRDNTHYGGGLNWSEFDHEWNNFFGSRGISPTDYPCGNASAPCTHGQLDTGTIIDDGGPFVRTTANLMTNPLVSSQPYTGNGYRCYTLIGASFLDRSPDECLQYMTGGVQSTGRWDRYADLYIQVEGDRVTFAALAVEYVAGQGPAFHFMERTVHTGYRNQAMNIIFSNLQELGQVASRTSDFFVDWTMYTTDTSVDLWTLGKWASWLRRRGRGRVNNLPLIGSQRPLLSAPAYPYNPPTIQTVRVESPLTVPAGAQQAWTAFPASYWYIRYKTSWRYRTRKTSGQTWSAWSQPITNRTLTLPQGDLGVPISYYGAQVEVTIRAKNENSTDTSFVQVARGCAQMLNGQESQISCSGGFETELGVASTATLSVFPNPASSALTLTYSLAEPAPAQLAVYDALGRVVYESDLAAEQGDQSQQIDVSTLAPGVYVARLSAGDDTLTRRFTVAR